MKILVVFAAIAAVCQAMSYFDVAMDEWNLYKISTRRDFRSTNEEYRRLLNFLRAKDLIAEHNLRYRKGLEDYEIGLNQFADRDPSENGQRSNTVNFMEERRQALQSSFGRKIVVPKKVKLPASVDWKKLGAVTQVIDQKECGSCYAITAAGTIEGQMFIKHKKLIRLSPQQILDCSKSYGNDGCDGGTFRNSFLYLTHHKLVSYESYPYENKDNAKCKAKGHPVSEKVKYYYYQLGGNEEKLKYALATYGPMAVGINANTLTFMLYERGIYNDSACDAQLSHAVLLTGYGTDPNTKKDYWIIKNSWGSHWGENGYMRIVRNQKMCGIGTLAYVPIIE